MKSSYRAVVIGGGIVGVSVLYHLTTLGWSDVALVERAELTAGSTWHAAAGFHALNGDPNIAAVQEYTINLYQKIEEESGQSCGLHMTGGVTIATDSDRFEQLKVGWSTFRAIGVDTAELVTGEEVRRLTGGVIRTDDIVGGLWDSNEGYLDPNGATHAFAACARKRGGDVLLRNRVVALHQRADTTWDVVTEQGTIHTEHVVNAGGLWAKQCGLMAGVDLPVAPMEHHYLITDAVEGLNNLPGELPVVADLNGSTYARQERDGLLLGVYERNPKHWHMNGAPWDFGTDLLPEDIDRIGEELADGFARFPELETVGIRRWVNGPFTFTPDGNPLVGPVGPRGYWVACGVMAGFSQCGGIGKALAEWMIQGAPAEDIYGMDVARFGLHQSNREYIRQTTAQFYARRMVMTYPNEELPAGRKLLLSGAYSDMNTAGAQWGNLWGLEVPRYFADTEFEEPTTLRRPASFPVVAQECATVQNAAGLLDISGYSRYRVTGTGARSWLDRLLACRLPAPGGLRLAPMLAEDGRLKGDLTCLNWSNREYWLMGSYYLRAFHMRWFRDHLEPDVQVEDISDTFGGFSISGPSARAIIQQTTETDLSDFAMMTCSQVDLGLHRVRLARLSLSGELSYEINCTAGEHASLRKLLLGAGAEYGLKEIGYLAMLSMRLEKSIGIWNADYTQACTPAMTGLDRWVAWDKGPFIGRETALKQKKTERVLTMLEIDANDADAGGFEPVWQGEDMVGTTTSGGYGHRLQKSLALAMIDPAFAQPGTALDVHVVGEPRPAKVIEFSPYDPAGARMRS